MNIVFESDATYLTVDCTGGFKSALLLYLSAKRISECGYDTIIIPLVTNRINGSGDPRWDRPLAEESVRSVVTYIRSVFPRIEIRDPEIINANFYWISVPVYNRDYNMIDVSEKTLLRHVYDFVINPFCYDEPDARKGVPSVISLNAQCRTYTSEHKPPYTVDKLFDNSIHLERGSGIRHSVKGGAVIVWQPFFNLNKVQLVDIANNLNIKDELKLLTQNCESSLKDGETCGVCYKCKENDWAKL